MHIKIYDGNKDCEGNMTFDGQYKDNVKFGLCWHIDEVIVSIDKLDTGMA